MNDKKTLGNWGEDKAALYLRLHGYRIVERNFRCRQGEIDVIARKGGVIAFVEVKLRKKRGARRGAGVCDLGQAAPRDQRGRTLADENRL